MRNVATSYLVKVIVALTSAIFCVLVAGCIDMSAASNRAYADVYAPASVSKNTVVTISAKEQKAYDRAVAACMDYVNQPNPIIIDMSDLGLTSKQALNVGEMLHANGELFWINTYNDSSYGRTKFSLPCYYDDAKITSMRKQLDAAVAKALDRVGPGMSPDVKVHMLHDYLIDNMKYTKAKKDAYTGLVEGKGDCFGYSLAMDLLLRRCGFSTDMAFNETLDHAWNVVKIGNYWYHIDVTFDAALTGKKYSTYLDWSKERCHLYLLQSDEMMDNGTYDAATEIYIDSHRGWSCHHKCADVIYDNYETCGAKGAFARVCNAYKSIVRNFSASGIGYEVIGVSKVKVVGVTTAKKRSAATLTIPASVTYKNVTYNVCGLGAKALATAKATTLRLSTPSLTSASVKGSLTGSKVTKVYLLDSAAKKLSAYKTYFKKANSGKNVTVSKPPAKKGTQTLKFKASQRYKVKLAKVKKRAQTVSIKKATGNKTAVTYAISKYKTPKAKKYFSIKKANAKTGKITVKKGTPKGTYRLTVKAKALANSKWKAATPKTSVITVVVA